MESTSAKLLEELAGDDIENVWSDEDPVYEAESMDKSEATDSNMWIEETFPNYKFVWEQGAWQVALLDQEESNLV